MYIGHKSEDGRTQPLLAHLENVAQLCGAYAQAFGAGELGRLIGLCHDLGKYSPEFQKRLLANGPKVDHSTAGGLELVARCGAVGAYCAFGHHGGLPDGGSANEEGTFYKRLKRRAGVDIPDYSAFQDELKLYSPAPPSFRPLGETGFSVAMLIRMLFSCLVDADFLDTENFMSDGRIQRGGYEGIPALCDKLDEYLRPWFTPTTPINRKRTEILIRCIEAAKGERGLYSLTVPTGGGKTRSSLAFALHHAKEYGLTRVIYVIPYTSIIEQNAAEFAEILGPENVLEHHAGVDYGNYDGAEDGGTDETKARHYLSAENWDAPVVVTTNVQFFESLFAAKTSKCRKLHNIANSVIIFDEAQMLPLPYLHACVRAIAELVQNYGCTAVLCSATQPALDRFFPPEVPCREICTHFTELYDFFRRTTLERLGTLTDAELAGRLGAQEQVLCIVSTRKQAQNLYQLIQCPGSYHLSTLMYPEHRKRILGEIRERLKKKQPCRVVATSLIEAGVDVDFPTVYRARAGLDSIIQAAGRCNREGKRPAGESAVYVFEPDSAYTLPLAQRQPAEVFELTAEHHREDLDAPEAIQTFFQNLYNIRGDALDTKKIVPRFERGAQTGSFPFRTVGQEFRLIESNTCTILIPETSAGADCAARLRAGERTRGLLRDAGRYSVNVYERHYKELCDLGIVEPLDSELAVLADLDSYSALTGLALTPVCGKGIFAE